MNRRHFLPIAATAAVGAAAGYYAWEELAATTSRPADAADQPPTPQLPADARQLLYLASLAPSGHNAQPWTVRLLAPYHWVIGTDPHRWLPAVDAAQRESLLSLGAFAQNLEYAAAHLAYQCHWQLRAATPQAREVLEVAFTHRAGGPGYTDVNALLTRRTLRTPFSYVQLSPADKHYLTEGDTAHWCYISPASGEGVYLRSATLVATQRQTQRDDAQRELAHWMRWHPAQVRRYRDGLTTAGLSLNGPTGWVASHFFDSASVLTPDFRQRSLARTAELTEAHGGWLVLSGDGHSVAGLLDTGRRLERLWLKARACNVAVHPMSQVLEEAPGPERLARHLGLSQPVQMVLRVGYVDEYPGPVSVRRPVEWFVQA